MEAHIHNILYMPKLEILEGLYQIGLLQNTSLLNMKTKFKKIREQFSWGWLIYIAGINMHNTMHACL